jgi:protein-tyrosine phosphatase
MAKHSVLFVCLGNICRSPMAEAVFDDLTKKKGTREQVSIYFIYKMISKQ